MPPVFVVLQGEPVERSRLLEVREVVSSENEARAHRISPTALGRRRSYSELVNVHRMAQNMLHVELRKRVVAREHLVVVHDESAYLKSLVVGCSFVMIYN